MSRGAGNKTANMEKTIGDRNTNKIVSPEGEEFDVAVEETDRILNEGLPFIIIDHKERRLGIMEGEYFLYTDMQGDIPEGNAAGFGLYHSDTRFLSSSELTINGRAPVNLSSNAERDYMCHIELTNADILKAGRVVVPQETLNIRRLRVVSGGLHERVRIKNYNPFEVTVDVTFTFGADFADIFEVRGLRRAARGKLLKPKIAEDKIVLAYFGEDEVFRQTTINVSAPPHSVESDHSKVAVTYRAWIKPYGRTLLHFFIQPSVGGDCSAGTDFNSAVSVLRRSYESWEKECTDISTDNELFNSVLERGRSDIRSLLMETRHGTALAAGVPWYAAPFGRDSLIASLQTLLLTARPARETLRLLAAFQGKHEDEWRDEEPGKILHEMRRGELANLREIPHTPYYGSIDSTPLFLILISEVFRWTNDLKFIEELRGAIEAALAWIDDYGDRDGDGFVEYYRKAKRGLINQGWKDSADAVMHDDGRQAGGPIALAEVQAYVYFAKKRMAQLFADLGDADRSMRLLKEADDLRRKFNRQFWMEDEGFFAMALDGNKQQVKTITSNPGQSLFTGIVDEDKAQRLAKRLVMPDMFSGWGVRTVSKSAKTYNPMSYHNGTVWPHDNAIIVRGLKRCGFVEFANIVATGLFDTANHHAYYRLPELFCGFTRRGNNWPVNYPVACNPQAWAAGSIFMVLQSILGMTPNSPRNTLFINRPTLPVWLNEVVIKNLRLGTSRLSISFTRQGDVTSFTVLKKEGNLKIIMED